MAINDMMDFLQQLSLFSSLEEEPLRALALICKERNFDRGQIIFYEEDQGTSLYIIESGRVKIVKLSDDGREHILGILQPKDFFGEMSLVDGEPRSATAIALEDATVLTITRKDFIHLLRQVPDIALEIMVTLCQRLRRTDRHVESLAFLSVPGRIAQTLLDMGDNEGLPAEAGASVAHHMTRQEMASIAGTSRETLTRVLMDFQRDGLIELKKNHVVILSPDNLRDRIS